MSLTVKDLSVSQAFYEKLGFECIGGDASQGWSIMKASNCAIGLFQGMFDKNTLTFNSGWDPNGQTLDAFTDAREIQQNLKAAGFDITSEADKTTSGPASCMVVDPDGNPILIGQHV